MKNIIFLNAITLIQLINVINMFLCLFICNHNLFQIKQLNDSLSHNCYIMQFKQCQKSITLQELLQFQTKEKELNQNSNNSHTSPFAIYMPIHLANNYFVYRLQSSGGQLPLIQLRKRACKQCITYNKQCSKCSKCKSQKQCCKDISHLFSYHEYLQIKSNEIYSCDCLDSLDYQIDWRLVALLGKITHISPIKYNYCLHLTECAMWITEETQNTVNRIFHQDNFGTYFHNQTQNVSNKLKEGNVLLVTSLIQQNCKKYLNSKQNWQLSNLEQQCQEVVDLFLKKKELSNLKDHFINKDSTLFINQPFLKFAGKFINHNAKTNKVFSKQLSNCSNPFLLFYYSHLHKIIFIKNAIYQNGDCFNNIRPINIEYNNFPQNQQSVWFKDRKGDLFLFEGQSLFIYKYNMKIKKFTKIPLAKNKIFSSVVQPQSLVYLPQKDRVYYFNARQLYLSFYLQLERESYEEYKQGDINHNSCTSITLNQKAFSKTLKKQKQKQSSICFCTYVIEDYQFKRERNSRKQLTPVIYILTYNKNNSQIPLTLYQVIAADNFQSRIKLIQTQTIFDNQNKLKLNFDKCGLFFSLKYNAIPKLYYYCNLETNLTLMEATIIEGDKPSVNWQYKQLQLSGCSNKDIPIEDMTQNIKLALNSLKKYSIRVDYSQAKSDQECINLTDFAGIGMNNATSFLGYISYVGRCVQFVLTCEGGKIKWKLFDLN